MVHKHPLHREGQGRTTVYPQVCKVSIIGIRVERIRIRIIEENDKCRCL
jgi:hypothetical protein